MTVKIANTELSSNFNTWRLNTNLIATTISNNVVTVAKEGRGGYAVGDGHVSGTFSATTLATPELRSGNTTHPGGWLYVKSNTSINSTSLAITSNTSFAANVNFNISADNRMIMPDISRIRITGGNNGEYLRKVGSDQLDFEPLTLRQITDLSSNSAHLILSGANTSFSDNGDSVHLVFGSGSLDHIHMYLAKDAIGGDSDLFLNLTDVDGDSRFVIADSSNTVVGYIDSDGNADFVGTLTAGGDTTLNGDVTLGDASTDTITVKGNFANQSTSGAATFNGDATFNGTSTFNGTMNINGNVNVGDAASDIMNVTSRSDLFGATNIGDANTDTVTVLAEVDSNFVPSTDNTYLLGKEGKEWKHIFANTVTSYNAEFGNDIAIGGTLSVDGSSTFNGDVTLGNETADTITVKGNFANQHTEGLATFGDKVGIATSSVTAGYQLENDGKSYFHDDALFANNVSIHGNLVIDGGITVPGDLIFTAGEGSFDDLTVTQSATLGNDATDTVTMTGSVTITGDVDHNGNLDVSDAITNDGTTVVSKLGKIHANNAILDGNIKSSMLANTGVSASSYGSATQIPVLTINNKGQITSAALQTVSGVTGLTYTQSNNNIRVTTANGKTWDDSIDPATTTSGTGRGVASFDTNGFSVSSGHVSLKNATTGAVLAVNGTANEVNVSRTNGTVTVGLPDDVTVTGQLNVGENVVIAGNLVVSGTTTTVNTETIKLADNLIELNSNLGSLTPPSQNGGIFVNRGSSSDVYMQFNETTDRWEFTNNGTVFYNVPVSSEYDNYTSWTIQDADGTSYTVTSGDTLQIAEGNGIDSNFTADDQLTITNTKPFDYFVVEDGDGTEVNISNFKEWKFVEGSGIDINWTDTDPGSDADPLDLTFTNTDRGSSQSIFKNIASDSGTAVADNNNDTLTIAGGTSINTSVSGQTVTVTHGDTSTLSGTYGSTDDGTKIDQITVDDRGHVTAITTGPGFDRFIVEDGDGTEVEINRDNEWKFTEGGGIDINWTDTSSGSDADPYDLTFTNTDKGSSQNIFKRVIIENSSGTDLATITADSNDDVLYLQEGTNVSLGYDTTNDRITISSSYVDTTYSAGSGLDLSGTTFSVESDLRDGIEYVGLDTSDYIKFVNSGSQQFFVDNGERMRIQNNGDLHVDSDVIAYSSTISDERLKENIQVVDNALEKIQKIRGVSFTRKINGKRSAGVIAQELEKILPEAVIEKTLPLQTGDDETMYKVVEYDAIHALLIESIKELKAEIDELKKNK
jgi:hypothetical protein